jgi:sugar lactone lactonase YvrE
MEDITMSIVGLLSEFNTQLGPRGGCTIEGEVNITEDPSTETIYLCSTHANAIYKLTRQGASILAGGRSALVFSYPHGILFDSIKKVLYVADTGNNSIKQVSSTGEVSILIGSQNDQTNNLLHPMCLAFTEDNELLVTDSCTHKIKMIDIENKTIGTLAGSIKGHRDGTALCAKFHKPVGIAVAKGGNIFVCDSKNCCIRWIRPNGDVQTVTGLNGNVLAPLSWIDCVPWYIVLTGDLFVITDRYGGAITIYRMGSGLKLLTVHNAPVNKCRGITSTMDGTILATNTELGRLARLRINTSSQLSKGSEEEQLYIK